MIDRKKDSGKYQTLIFCPFSFFDDLFFKNDRSNMRKKITTKIVVIAVEKKIKNFKRGPTWRIGDPNLKLVGPKIRQKVRRDQKA